MPKILEQQYDLSVSETEVVSINYSDVLDSGELLTGTPTVTEVSTANLSLANKLVSTATYVESFSGETVAVGKAVQFTVSTSTAGLYQIRVSVATDSSPARTLVRDLYVRFI